MRIFDCVIFYRELDLLDIRFHELADVVDHFVVVESDWTFRGTPKPMYFADAELARFAQFSPKIVAVESVGEVFHPDPWVCEAHARDLILDGLDEAQPDDIVLMSDVDEIPSSDSLRYYISRGFPPSLRFFHRQHYYKLNRRTRLLSGGTVAVRAGDLTDHPSSWRKHRVDVSHLYGGWHYSCMGGADAIIDKLGAFSHSEVDIAPYNTREHLNQAMSQGNDFLGRPEQYVLIPVDATFPKYVRENQEHFEEIGLLEPI